MNKTTPVKHPAVMSAVDGKSAISTDSYVQSVLIGVKR